MGSLPDIKAACTGSVNPTPWNIIEMRTLPSLCWIQMVCDDWLSTCGDNCYHHQPSRCPVLCFSLIFSQPDFLYMSSRACCPLVPLNTLQLQSLTLEITWTHPLPNFQLWTPHFHYISPIHKSTNAPCSNGGPFLLPPSSAHCQTSRKIRTTPLRDSRADPHQNPRQ
jgi:hypothetical protein